MTNLVAATVFFVLIHLAVAGTRLRDALVRRIGENAYLGAFSLASITGLVWMIAAFGDARGGPAWWGPTPATRWIQLLVSLAAVVLVVAGVTTRNPAAVRQESALEGPDVVKGVLRITRHPFLWGVALWAAGHLLVNGDAPSLVLFGSLLALALAGTASIDAKRRRKLGGAWDGFAAMTSNLPFAAAAAGRQRIRPGEIGLWRIGLAVAVWAALLWAHPMLFGVRAAP